MATSQVLGLREPSLRNRIVENYGLAHEISAVTLASNAGTMSNPVGQITTEALTTAAAGSQALALTCPWAEAGDWVSVSWNGGTSTGGTPVFRAVATAGTITITAFNMHASDAFDGTFILAVELRKKLTTITRNQ